MVSLFPEIRQYVRRDGVRVLTSRVVMQREIEKQLDYIESCGKLEGIIGDLDWQSFSETQFFEACVSDSVGLQDWWNMMFRREWYRRKARVDVADLAAEGADFREPIQSIALHMFVDIEQTKIFASEPIECIGYDAFVVHDCWLAYQRAFRVAWFSRREASHA